MHDIDNRYRKILFPGIVCFIGNVEQKPGSVGPNPRISGIIPRKPSSDISLGERYTGLFNNSFPFFFPLIFKCTIPPGIRFLKYHNFLEYDNFGNIIISLQNRQNRCTSFYYGVIRFFVFNSTADFKTTYVNDVITDTSCCRNTFEKENDKTNIFDADRFYRLSG